MPVLDLNELQSRFGQCCVVPDFRGSSLDFEDVPALRKGHVLRRLLVFPLQKMQIQIQSSMHIPGQYTYCFASDTVDVALTYTLAAAASLPSAGASRARAPTLKWKPEEDAKLLEAVKKFGQVWMAVALLVPGRTNSQCRQRWVNLFGPRHQLR
jgi:hypothetical protein